MYYFFCLADTSCHETLPAALDAVLERTQDFTDSAYTSHDHREAILESSERLKVELDHVLGLYANVVTTYFILKSRTIKQGPVINWAGKNS